jgi:hypothetical protein
MDLNGDILFCEVFFVLESVDGQQYTPTNGLWHTLGLLVAQSLLKRGGIFEWDS